MQDAGFGLPRTPILGTWLNKYVSTRISGCPPPFVHSMNVSGNSPLIVGREGVPDYVVDVPMDVSGD
jgi:hypothetical protein